MQIIYTGEGKIEGVKLLSPSQDLMMDSDVLGPDMIVKSIDIMGAGVHCQMFCSPRVVHQLNRFAMQGQNESELMACFHASLFIKHYLPETQWEFDEDTDAWDTGVMAMITDMQSQM